MFTEEGIWKEFGIGRDPERYTWLPFWLFSIIWAILSYIIVITVLGYQDDGCYTIIQQSSNNISDVSADILNVSKGSAKKNNRVSYDDFNIKNNLKPGYYIKNNNSNNPKYTYIGEEPPDIINMK